MLVDRLYPALSKHELATTDGAAINSPNEIRRGKNLLQAAWHADERTGLELEAKLQRELVGSPNPIESIKANFEKRAADY